MNALILLRDWQESQIEMWRVIPGMPEHDVSNMGRVRSWHGSVRRRPKPLMLKPSIHRQGYLYVEPQYSGKKIYGFIHRLVALAFIPNPDSLPEVNHLVGIKNDNRVDGLEWSTRKQNQQHAWAAGLITTKHLVDACRRKPRRFTDEQIREMRRRGDAGEFRKDIAMSFNLTRRMVDLIVNRQSYVHVL